MAVYLSKMADTMVGPKFGAFSPEGVGQFL